jgi:adenine C2-methylase RlmN of 23S rRNA A2503 and tRNA A37
MMDAVAVGMFVTSLAGCVMSCALFYSTMRIIRDEQERAAQIIAQYLAMRNQIPVIIANEFMAKAA